MVDVLISFPAGNLSKGIHAAQMKEIKCGLKKNTLSPNAGILSIAVVETLHGKQVKIPPGHKLLSDKFYVFVD